MRRDWNIRTIYLYLVCFVTLIMMIIGTVQTVDAIVTLAYPPPLYYPTPEELKMQAPNQNVPVEVLQERARIEQQRQEQQVRYERVRFLAGALALLVVALPIYMYHWRKVQEEAKIKLAGQ